MWFPVHFKLRHKHLLVYMDLTPYYLEMLGISFDLKEPWKNVLLSLLQPRSLGTCELGGYAVIYTRNLQVLY